MQEYQATFQMTSIISILFIFSLASPNPSEGEAEGFERDDEILGFRSISNALDELCRIRGRIRSACSEESRQEGIICGDRSKSDADEVRAVTKHRQVIYSANFGADC